MSIFTTSGSAIYIGPQVASDQTLGQYEALDTASLATGSVAFSANPVTTSTLVINGTSIEFITTFVSGNEVQIGYDITATLADLLEFLNASMDTQLVKMTYALAGAAGPLLITSVLGGVAGNAYTLSLGGTTHATLSAATLLGGGGSGWSQIGEVENLGDFGDSSAKVTFASIADGRVRKMKGSRDAGDMKLVVGQDARDVGQLALSAAQATKSLYAFKLVASDQRLTSDTPSIFYWNALVASQASNFGANNNVVKTTYSIEIDSAILEVASAPA